MPIQECSERRAQMGRVLAYKPPRMKTSYISNRTSCLRSRKIVLDSRKDVRVAATDPADL